MMLPPATRVYLACGVTDMRKGFDGLAAVVQTMLPQTAYGGGMGSKGADSHEGGAADAPPVAVSFLLLLPNCPTCFVNGPVRPASLDQPAEN